MKKIIASLVMLSVLLNTYSLPFKSLCTNAVEEYERFTYSFTLENTLSKNDDAQSFSDELFNKFLKYSLLVSDETVLTADERSLCRKIYETEMTCVPYISCPYARETIKSSEAPKRITLEDKSLLADMADPSFSSVELNSYYPDIVFYDSEHYSQISEYWLDDSGRERIVSSSNLSFTPYYEIIFEEEPSPSEQDEIMTECNGAGTLYESNDGSYYIFRVELDGEQYQDCLDYETYTSDIWVYRIMNDGSALIVDSTLPTDNEAETITEPVSLPTELDGYTVYGIDEALSFTGVTKLIIPDNYKYIKLSNMESLKEVEINAPELVLRAFGFSSCPNLESAVLNVERVENNAFVNCNSLKSVKITEAENISYSAFAGLSALREVVLPEGLKSIGQDAFTDTSVTELTIPESVEIVGAVLPPYKNFDIISVPITDKFIKIADEGCIIKSYYNSEAHNYAIYNNYKFIPLNDIEYGDINNDGKSSVSDMVTLGKWLNGSKSTTLDNWQAADFCSDGKIDVFDLVAMKDDFKE